MKNKQSVQNTAGTHTVKVWDYLIENPETLDASVVDALFSVEIRKVWDGSKHHTYFIVRLAVQLLQTTNDKMLVFLNKKLIILNY